MNLPFDEFRKQTMMLKHQMAGGDNIAINKLGGALENAMADGIDLVQWLNPKVFPLIQALHEELAVEVRARLAPPAETETEVQPSSEDLTEVPLEP